MTLSNSGDVVHNTNALAWPEHIIHSRQSYETKLSASSGCHFCSIILSSINGCTGDHEDRHDHEQSIYISIASLDRQTATYILTLFACEQKDIYSHDQILNSFQLILRPLKGKTDRCQDLTLTVIRWQQAFKHE